MAAPCNRARGGVQCTTKATTLSHYTSCSLWQSFFKDQFRTAQSSNSMASADLGIWGWSPQRGSRVQVLSHYMRLKMDDCDNITQQQPYSVVAVYLQGPNNQCEPAPCSISTLRNINRMYRAPSLSSNYSQALQAFLLRPPSLPLWSNTTENPGIQLQET